MNKYLALIMMIIILMGCSRHRNIEQLSLVIGVGIDSLDTVNEKTDQHNLMLTHQTLVSPDRGGMSSSSSSPYKNIVTKGPTVHEITRDIALKQDPLFSQHQRILVFGEQAGKTFKLDALMDQLARDNEIRRSCLIFVTNGQAKDILTIKGMDTPPVNVIYDLVENRYRTNKILPTLSLGEISAKLETDQSFLVQRVSKLEKDIQLNGAALIKGRKIYAFLSQNDLQALSWLRGDIQGGIVYGKHGRYPFSFEIGSVKQKVKTKVKNDHSIHFDVYVKTSGRLSEDWDASDQKLSPSFINHIEKNVEKIIKSDTSKIVQKLQNDYQADAIEFREYVRINHPSFWKKHRKEWDTIFSNSTIDYHINVTIEDFGAKTDSG